MALYALDSRLWFPPVEEADDDGLLAMGGDLSTERLLLAYRKGIFPWYDGDLPLWWCPDPRFVLYPQQLKVSKSMKVLLKRNTFEVTVNKAFATVIQHCSAVTRKGQDGTWISNEVAKAYTTLHQLGHAHSVEAWKDGQLAGGLYGIRMGQLFFGESMFSLQPNASKYAFITYVQQLQQQGVQLVDCQVYTEHLESLGAGMISRQAFLQALQQWL
jgi:leucyl/phenylalanyl-tRNA--protein transferase